MVRGLLSCDDLSRAMESAGGEGPFELLECLDALGILTKDQQVELARALGTEASNGGDSAPTPAIAWKSSSPRTSAQQFQTATMLPSWGPYRNLRFIGEGGMGRIFQAYDPSLRRVVALKILRGDAPEQVLRFLLEAQNQAAVEHANICRVYEVGEWQGYSFIAMQFIVGECLDLLSPRISLRQKVEVMRTVAEAIHAAHRQGLIHRDIKPANIMVEREENGRLRPYVLDFGLARGPDASGFTVTGLVLGTTHYMAPEQARGDNRLLDRRTDVYSLGATLYRVLSGQPPVADFEGVEAPYLGYASDLDRLRRLRPGLPRELCAIVAKAMEKEPDKRYPTAEAMGEDLGRYLEGEAILAAPPAWGYRALKFIQKRKSQCLLATVALCMALVFGGLAVTARMRSTAQIQLAQQLGLEAAGLEAEVRYTHLLPVHDIHGEMLQIQKRVEGMKERGAHPGQAALGPIAYALGRAALASGDAVGALNQLELAWCQDHRTPDVAYRMARAMMCIHARELDAARRGGRGRAAALESDRAWRGRIIASLRESRGASLESADFIEALLAFHEGRLETSAQLAHRAVLVSPWLYEARALQAEIQMALAETLQEEGAVLLALEKASADLQAAQAMAPCDPTLRELELRRCEQELNWRRAKGLAVGNALEAMQAAREVRMRLQPT